MYEEKDPDDDPYLEAFYPDHIASSDDTDSGLDTDDWEDELDEYTVTFHYSAEARVSVEAADEHEAKRKAKEKRLEEGIQPEPTDLVHTRVSNW